MFVHTYGNRNRTHARRKFRDCVGLGAWVDWPSESFAGKDQDRQARGLPVGGRDKKASVILHNCTCATIGGRRFHERLCVDFNRRVELDISTCRV